MLRPSAAASLADNLVDILSRPDYLAKLNTSDAQTVINGLSDIFCQNEIPSTLISKLLPLQDANLHFKIDNSGSMAEGSNLNLHDSYRYNRADLAERHKMGKNRSCTRWEEAEDRIHIILDLLAYIPTNRFELSFFDYEVPGKRLILHRRDETPIVFAARAHEQLHDFFIKNPPRGGSTPIEKNLAHMLQEAQNPDINPHGGLTMHYLLTDGQPTEGQPEVNRVKNLIQNRAAPELNRLMLLGCSDKPENYEWIHQLAEIDPFTAALFDFKHHTTHVKEAQGDGLTYSKGLWILSNLVAVLHPDDLNALDKHVPFTKAVFDELIGERVSEARYLNYFNLHPKATKVFGPSYQQFLTVADPCDIPAARVFQTKLASKLNKKIAANRHVTEEQALECAEEAVCEFYKGKKGVVGSYGTLYYAPPAMQVNPRVKDRTCQCTLT